jgi:23S rRNA U2552 (ribose-2'-O)-methylase RlmE/FtsJ
VFQRILALVAGHAAGVPEAGSPASHDEMASGMHEVTRRTDAVTRRMDVVLSDMAPNLSGMDVIDQPRAMYLAELALDMAQRVLKPHGTALIKVFQGAGFQELVLRRATDLPRSGSASRRLHAPAAPRCICWLRTF